MAFIRPKDRVAEKSTTAGTGPYALAGAIDASYNAFSASMSIGDTTIGAIVEPGVAFATGLLTYSAANQITLTTAYETKGTFGAGTKEIFMGLPASRAVYRNGDQAIDGNLTLGGGYYFDALFASSIGNYYTLQGQSAETKISLGPAADKKTYYDANGHVWRGVGSSPSFMQLDSTALAMLVPTRTLASTATSTGLRVPTGVAPTSPVDGDIWNDGADAKIRIGSVTYSIKVDYATKSDQQAASSAVKTVSPARQGDHPSAAKAWVTFGGGVGGTIAASHNVTSVSRTSAGNYTITFTVPFATASYSCVVTTEGNATAGIIGHVIVGGRTAGSLQVEVLNVTPVGADATVVHVACYGAQ
jgi:hypothetical protein